MKLIFVLVMLLAGLGCEQAEKTSKDMFLPPSATNVKIVYDSPDAQDYWASFDLQGHSYLLHVHGAHQYRTEALVQVK